MTTTINQDLLNGATLNEYAAKLISNGDITKEQIGALGAKAGSPAALFEMITAEAQPIKDADLAERRRTGKTTMVHDGPYISQAIIKLATA